MHIKPQNQTSLFHSPVKVFFAVIIVALIFLFPVSKPTELPNETARLQPYPLGIQSAEAQGCGVCQYFGCIEYIYNEDPEDGSDWTVCVRNGCKAIPGCVPLPPTTTFAITCGASGNDSGTGWCRESAVAEINVTNSQGKISSSAAT